MRTLFAPICLAAAIVVGCSDYSDDTARVTAVVGGKPLPLSPATQHELIKQSIALLRSCGYGDLHPTNDLADVQKRPHLHFTFSEPRKLKLRVAKNLAASGKVEVEPTEMVITLPLSRGGIWVRSHQDTLYFAKFICTVATEMTQTLAKAERP